MSGTWAQALSIIAQFATVIGILLLYKQIQSSHNAVESQLINELEKEFSTCHAIFAKLKRGGAWYERTTLGLDDVAQLENLASFCEKLKHFHDRNILDWHTLDLMFRNRFFLIMHNPNVIADVINPCPQDWEAALALEREWIMRLPQTDPRRALGAAR